MGQTLYLTKFETIDSFEELLEKYPGLVKTVGWSKVVDANQAYCDESSIVKSKYIVIFNSYGKPFRCAWIMEDEEELHGGRYAVVYFWNMKREWEKPLTKLASLALKCRQKQVRILNGTDDMYDQE